ncbi:MAG TPA: polymer-forming cytoskeletal protein [Candidatus Magasanikbacteria bacterium]|nr:polymer-forming cytoskeletal protein [Candidatus Magasanikbacteria bacterium]
MFQRPSPNIALGANENNIITHADEVETVVGPSVHVEGDFSSEGNIIVKGTVSGNVKTSRVLTVEEGAKIFANVRANDAIISGEVKGDVKVGEKLELTDSARIAGDIDCKVLVVEAGALIHGKITMKGIEAVEKSEKQRDIKRGLGFGGKGRLSLEETDLGGAVVE